MEPANQNRLLNKAFLLLCAGLCACSDSGSQKNATQEEDISKTKAVLSPTSSADYLKQALAWAKEKSPETMAAELAGSDWSKNDELLSWQYYIVRIAFIEAYGEEDATKRMQEIHNRSAQTAHTANNRINGNYRGQLGEEYPEIYEIALQQPDKAIENLEALLIHPNELDTLRSEVLLAYSKEEPEKALEMTHTTNDVRTFQTQKLILHDWAEREPRAAIAYLDVLAEKHSVTSLRHGLLLDVVRSHPMIALEAAANSPINHMNDWTLEKVAESYVRSNPEAGFEWLMQQDTLSDDMLEAGVDGLSSQHPDLADQLMKTVAPERWQFHFIRNIAQSKARKNIEEAMTWAAGLPLASHRTNAYLNILSIMAREQPDQIFSKLDSIQDFGISPDEHEKLAEALASGAPDTALNWAKTAVDSPAAARIFGLAAQEVIKNNPRRVGEILSVMDDSPYKREMIGTIIEGWFDTDRNGALDWVKNKATQNQIDKIVPEISKEWFGSDKNAALDFAKGLPPGEARTSILKRYIYSDSERNLAQVVQLIDAVEGDTDLYNLTKDAFSRGADVQPQKAKALALSIRDPEKRDHAIRGLAMALVDINPKDAAEWVGDAKFSNDENMKWAVAHLVDHYGRHDSKALAEWIVNLPDDKKRHLAAVRAAPRIVKSDVATAVRLVNSAQPGRSRSLTVIGTIENLPNPSSRNTFVNSVFLTQEEQEQVRKERERRGL